MVEKFKFYEIRTDDKIKKQLAVVKAKNFKDAGLIFQTKEKNIPIRVRRVELEYTDNPKDKIKLLYRKK